MADKVTAGTAKEAGGHGKVFPPLDPNTFAPQLIWLALTFGLLYVILKRVALPRIGEVIEERRDRIKRDLEQAERLKVETEQALATYEAALADARAKAGAVAKEARDKLNAEIEAEKAKVDAQIAQQLAEAEASIAQTKSKALASVEEISADVATAIISRLLGREVSRDEVKKALVQRAAE